MREVARERRVDKEKEKRDKRKMWDRVSEKCGGYTEKERNVVVRERERERNIVAIK